MKPFILDILSRQGFNLLPPFFHVCLFNVSDFVIVAVILGQLDLMLDPVPQNLVGGGILPIMNKGGLAFLYEHFNFFK